MAQNQSQGAKGQMNKANSRQHRKHEKKYQTYRLVKQDRCDERHIANLVKRNRMTIPQARAFWMRQKGKVQGDA
jgi:hypothetical protein